MTDTETAFDFSTIESIESEPDMSNEVATCNAPGCMNPVATYSGRGPRPKKCVDHKGKSATSTPRKKKTYGTDYREGITGLLQLPAGILGIVGMQTNNLPLVADAAVIEMHTPAIASALNDLAQERPEVAAVLDKVLKAGPYGAILAAVVPMTVQLLANHNVIKAGMMGTKTPEDLLGIPRERREDTPDAG